MKAPLVYLFSFLLVGSPAPMCAAPIAELGHVEGRVLVRTQGQKKLQAVKAGHALEADETLITGDASRFEVRPQSGGGVWRVGRRAVFSIKETGARLLAGTALVQVPSGETRRVESTRSIIKIPEGTWLVQAVDNRGFKIVCLDGAMPVEAWGAPDAPADFALSTLELRPGDLAFLQPGGTAFSPRVTIFLEETLATSRLVGGFPEPVSGMPRLINQAIAQRERLKRVSNAVVVGAPTAGTFQIAVPKPENAEK